MKRTYKILHTLFAVIIAISCISCSNKRVDILSTIPEGFAPMYMCGNVKEVIVTSEYMCDTIKLDKVGRIIQKGHRHYSYDADGVLISQQAGHIKNEYVYDGNLLVATKCYRHNTLDDIYKYFYNDQRQIVSKKWYSDDELKNEWQYEYNEEGYISCERDLSYSTANYIYNRLGYKVEPSKTRTIYSYDKNGNIIKEDYYNNSNEISRSTNFKYDKRCNVVYEEELDYDDMEKEVITYKYKYDRKGNWIEQVASCNGETRTIKREIIYY